MSEACDRHPFSDVEGYANLRDLLHERERAHGSSYQNFGFFGADVDMWTEIPFYGRMKRINGARKDLHNIHT
ncbi:MAG: hypothetical protein M2R45_00569 [Verrucomicrobia subdivision 3 bacterium]|nr:hypothetical protein [Limisphaerales bacterium]MCS1413554.1 hypothetical protein [Limisphaerales bacterium]